MCSSLQVMGHPAEELCFRSIEQESHRIRRVLEEGRCPNRSAAELSSRGRSRRLLSRDELALLHVFLEVSRFWAADKHGRREHEAREIYSSKY